MQTATTNSIAKVAAVVAGLGLIAMSFAFVAPAAKADTTSDLQAQISSLLAQIAALQAQLGTSSTTTTSTTFTRDLTIGSTGADVTALQTWLISKGFAISAGATGYFGAQTQAALAAYQAANAITPAAGYFGPITRAKVNASAGTTTGTTTTTTTTTSTAGLTGGEADLTSYDLISEDGSFSEGDSNVKVATAEFDVSGGDVSVQRADLNFQAVQTAGTADVKPWKYIKSISVYDGTKKLATVDASDQDAWDDNDTITSLNSSGNKSYKISITGINDVVKEDDTAELTFAVTAQSSIDQSNEDQSFTIGVPNQGIRAVDAAGIQQYTGSDSDKVTVDIDSPENGNLTIKEASADPDAGILVADDTDTSSSFSVFAFDVKNSDDNDTKVTDLTINVGTTTASGSHASDITDVIRKATLTFAGKDYDGDINANNTISFNDMDAIVGANDTETGTLKITLYGQSGHFAMTGESLTFSLAHGNVAAEGADSGDSVATGDISGTANGNQQSIAVNGGINVAGKSSSETLVTPDTTVDHSYGTFTLKFDVTAIGDDVYVPKGVASTSGSSSLAGVVFTPDLSTAAGNGVTASLSTTADSDNTNFYVVHEGDTETFTLTVAINPTASGFYQVGLDKVRFSSNDTDLNNLQTLEIDQNDSQFHTDPLNIPS